MRSRICFVILSADMLLFCGCDSRPNQKEMATDILADKQVSEAAADPESFRELSQEVASQLIANQQSKSQPNPSNERSGDLYRIAGRVSRKQFDETLDATRLKIDVDVADGITVQCSLAPSQHATFHSLKVGTNATLNGSYLPNAGASVLAFTGCQAAR
jgi:hypothetical protein